MPAALAEGEKARKVAEKDRAITADLQRIVSLPGGLVTLLWNYVSSLKQLSGRTAHLPFSGVFVAVFPRNMPFIDETGSRRLGSQLCKSATEHRQTFAYIGKTLPHLQLV